MKINRVELKIKKRKNDEMDLWFGCDVVWITVQSRSRDPASPINYISWIGFRETERNDEGSECVNGGSDVDAGPLAPCPWQRKHTLRIGVVVRLCRRLLFPRPLRWHHVRSHPRTHVSGPRGPRDPRTQWFSCRENASWYFLVLFSFFFHSQLPYVISSFRFSIFNSTQNSTCSFVLAK